MRALVFDPDQPYGLRLGEAPDPEPGGSDALIAVEATSLNFGELAMRADGSERGAVFGWDAAGVVVRAAADGSGPPAGARVVTFGWDGAWAELRSVDTAELAVVPDSVDLGASSALPVAGVTALQALRRLGSVVGRRVLITGASGGVGRFAIQLAARSGAHVIASVGSLARGEGLSELGATEVVVGIDGVSGKVFGVLDNVGGPQLAKALTLVEEGGSVQWIGRASRTELSLDVTLVEGLNGCQLEFFLVRTPFGPHLAYLVDLLSRGELDPQIGWRGSWEYVDEAAYALLDRRVPGKVVLDIG
jgi:NADPH:quinone reductase